MPKSNALARTVGRALDAVYSKAPTRIGEVMVLMHVTRLVAIGLLGFVIGCGGRSLEMEFETHPAKVLPQGASQIAFARADRLRDNPLIMLAYERAQTPELGPSLLGANRTLKLAGAMERLALGTYGAAAGKEPAAAIVAAGRFDENAFRKALESSRIPHVEGSYGRHRFYTCGRGDERCYVSFTSPRLVVAASQEDLLKRTLDMSRRGAKNMMRDRGFAPLLQSFSPQLDLWVTGAFPAALATAFGPQVQQAIEMIRAFTIRLAGGENAQLKLTLHCASQEAAEANAMFLRKLLASVTQQMVLAGYRISELISAINRSQIVVEGRTAEFNFAINKADMAATAAALQAEPVAPTIEGFPPAAPPEKRTRNEER